MGRQDKIANALARSKRRFFDHAISQGGREVQVLRFFTTADKYEDETQTVINSNPITAILNYPPGDIPLYRFRKTGTDAVVDTTGMFFFDIIPFEIFIKFEDNVERGDYIVHFVKDDKDHNMCIVLQISNAAGGISTELVWKKYFAAPYSGSLPAEVTAYIDANL